MHLTSTARCSTPDVFNLRLNSHSRLKALIQAIKMGADEALMLDDRGFACLASARSICAGALGPPREKPGDLTRNLVRSPRHRGGGV